MTNEQIKGLITTKRLMLGEFASRMSPINGDECPINTLACDLFEKCQNEIDRLELTLEVRKQASEITRTMAKKADINDWPEIKRTHTYRETQAVRSL